MPASSDSISRVKHEIIRRATGRFPQDPQFANMGAYTYYITLMGWKVSLGFVIVCYIWWGFDFCYISLKMFNICHFLPFSLTFNNFTAVFVFLNCYIIKIIELPN